MKFLTYLKQFLLFFFSTLAEKKVLLTVAICNTFSRALYLYQRFFLKHKSFVCMPAHSSVVSNAFATLWTTAGQAPLSMRFYKQEYWSGLLFPPPSDLPYPGIKPTSPASPAFASLALQADSLPLSHLGSFVNNHKSHRLFHLKEILSISMSRIQKWFSVAQKVSGFQKKPYLNQSSSSNFT